MNKITSHTILQIERAASDIRRGQPVLLRQSQCNWRITPGEYVAEPKEGYVTDSNHPAVKLMKIAGLLPKAIVEKLVDNSQEDLLAVSEEAIEQYPAALADNLEKISEARVPLKEAENARVIAFRARFDHQDHLAIIIGEPEKEEAPFVRLHSSCVTGDVLGSLRCDCGEQLQQSIAVISKRKGGVLLYLNQEGRGINIANKLRAYELQDEGMDTVEANEALGFLPDERDFAIAAQMLKQLGLNRVILMTNNPEKIKSLAAHGIEVIRRESVVTGSNMHNHRYLDTKSVKLGHHLKE